MGIIFILSSIPGNYFPEQPFDLFDKLVHACLFGILTYLIYRGFQYQDKSAFFKNFSIAIAFLICVIYGIIDELHQEYIPGRSPDITDALADILGGGFVSLYLLFFNYRKTKRR
ncbi:VanZ like family protein [Candidatus Kryptobacter tengchongensis]|nr:VanZ family protein [Candidatus Kryptobacter tengchongensis]CUS78359.1 VanZ like family protein [Candidatus Kryptobacter tengchongensis]